MSYQILVLAHLVTVSPAFLVGSWLMFRPKGKALHRLLGRVFMALMMITAIITLWMPAQLGSTWLNHFGVIHLLSLLTLVSVPRALIAARKGDVKAHAGTMISLYVGGLLVAGGFAFMPGRLLNTLLFG